MEVEGAVGTGFVVEGQGVVPAGGYGVLATRRAPTANGGIEGVLEEYSINEMRLYLAGSIEMYTPSGIQLDQVTYDSTSTHPSGLGASIAAGALDSYENDFASTWCEPTSTFGDGAYGTPGLENDACDVPLSLEQAQVGDLIVSEIIHTPTSVSDTKGEWFEIHNTTSDAFILTGLEISSESGEGFSVTDEVVIEAGGYFVFAVRQSAAENGGIENVGYRYYVNVFRLYSTDSIILQKQMEPL